MTEPAANKNAIPKKQPRIVVADDNAHMRSTLKDILEEHGYAVDTVQDGYDLLAYLKKNEPRIIILDLMMPEKNGIEVFDCLKCLWPKAKVIIYTGFNRYEDSSLARLADKFILKNTPFAQLLEVIKDLL